MDYEAAMAVESKPDPTKRVSFRPDTGTIEVEIWSITAEWASMALILRAKLFFTSKTVPPSRKVEQWN